MTLAAEDLEQLRHLVEEVVDERAAALSPKVHYEIEVRDRVIRVEEELRHQRELMAQGFRLMEKRSEQVDRRLDQVDKRFEELREDMKDRFEAVDRRFEVMDRRFEELREDMKDRFEAMDKRFESVDRRFEVLIQRVDRLVFWMFGMMVAVGSLVVAAIKYLPAPGG